MIPNLSSLLKASTELFGLGDGDIRLGLDERCLQALGTFAFMARETTEHDLASIALFAGRSMSTVQTETGRIELRMQADAAFADLVLEACYTAAAVDEISGRKGRRAAEKPTQEIATRLLKGRADALTLSRSDLAQLAAAYLGQLETMAAFRGEVMQQAAFIQRQTAVRSVLEKLTCELASAWREFECHADTYGEKFARKRLDKAAEALAEVIAPRPIKSTKTKENAHV